MLTRAEVLERFGLPDSAAFEMEPLRDDQGIWRIRVSYEGGGVTDMSIGSLTRLADEIRPVDHHLEEQARACLKMMRRNSENSN